MKAAYHACPGESSIDDASISVESRKGIGQLSGFVDSQKAVDKAGEIARGVNGVKSVRNDLIVK